MLKYLTMIFSVLIAVCLVTYSGLMTTLESSSDTSNNSTKEDLPIGSFEVWIYDYPMADVQVLVSSQVLAIKNRNPLNIKSIANNEPWKGQIGTDSQGHAIFSSFSYGLRAAALTLRAYDRKYGLNTLEGIINRFTEGDKIQIDKYILFLSVRLGVEPHQRISIKKHLPNLLRYMSRYECGITLPESLFTPYDILAEM
ncbi:MAG: hypothetical protein IKN64_04035 [Desulfovibrio sp.]|nr:hypothetical protein [Desulfovibrio sp.]